jgi:surface antigen
VRRGASRGHRTPVVHHQHTAAPTATRTHASTGYPWASDTTGGRDPWGFTKRQCVSYVAWRLDGVGRSIGTRQGWGSASGWDDVARRRGVTVTSRPAVGSVAQWNAGESSRVVSGSSRGTFVAGSYGHVGWVTAVYTDGSVQVAQYNGSGTRSYSTMRVFAPRFLRL